VESVLSALPVLPVTLEVARLHSQLWADLERRGEIIGAHDLLIAATALTHDLAVVTGNHRHFGKVAGLKITIW
jgi:predicted nucleic acid-binding protein